jgi:hypothetical protein
MAANWTPFVSGAVLTASQLNGVVDNFADMAIFREEQASGTNGGTFTSGSYIKRTLNTTVVNNIMRWILKSWWLLSVVVSLCWLRSLAKSGTTTKKTTALCTNPWVE